MQTQTRTVIDLWPQSHRSLAGHVLSIGVHVFVFGVLAYLTFLAQGGIPGELLLIYVSTLPLTIAIWIVVGIARAKDSLGANHVIGGCLGLMLLCCLGGVWFVFAEQIMLTLGGALAVIWLTRYSPVAKWLMPPSLGDVARSAQVGDHRSLRTAAMIGGGLALLVGGLALTVWAVYSQAVRPGGLSITLGV